MIKKISVKKLDEKAARRRTKTFDRNVSMKVLPPTEDKCNAALAKRDGYCSIKPSHPGSRCPSHSESLMSDDARMLFKNALSIEEAKKLEMLIQDSTSMDGEIGVAKLQLIDELKTMQEAKAAYVSMMHPDIMPKPPSDGADTENLILYRQAIREHMGVIAEYKELYQDAKQTVNKLTDMISKAVERNNKVLHTTKYSLSLEQLNTFLLAQADIFENHCLGCAKLALIANDLKNIKIKGIGSVPDIERINNIKPISAKTRAEYKKAVEAANVRIVEEANVEIMEPLE